MRLSFQDNNVHRLHHIISNVLGSIDSEPCQRSLHQRKKEEQIDPFLYLARVRPRLDNSLKGRAHFAQGATNIAADRATDK